MCYAIRIAKTMSQFETTLGRHAVSFEATVNASRRSTVPRQVTRQTLYTEDEADFDPDQHVPTKEYQSELSSRRLTDQRFYEDPYAEAEGALIPATDAEIAQFRADLASDRFIALAADRSRTHDVAGERRRRDNEARKGMEPAAVAEMQRRPKTLLDSVATENRKKIESVAPKPRTEVNTPVNIRTIDSEALRSMLSVDCLRGLTPKVKANFTRLACTSSIFRELQPLLYVHEPDRRHENTKELIERLETAGAKLESTTRMLCRARIGAVLDQQFYESFLTRNGRTVVLNGGHEHYDAARNETRILVLTFRCVLRNRENKHSEASSEAQREMRKLEAQRRAQRLGVSVVEEAQREAPRHPAYADPFADIFKDDTDDDYDGGQDIKILARHFVYRLDVVCVEAIDAHHRDETRDGSDEPTPTATLQPPTTFDRAANVSRTGGILDPALAEVDFGAAADEDAEKKLEKQILPLGTMRITHDRAAKLGGRYRAEELKRLLNQTENALAPLCVRAFAFSTDLEEAK